MAKPINISQQEDDPGHSHRPADRDLVLAQRQFARDQRINAGDDQKDVQSADHEVIPRLKRELSHCLWTKARISNTKNSAIPHRQASPVMAVSSILQFTFRAQQHASSRQVQVRS
jgi:hypothetical protein